MCPSTTVDHNASKILVMSNFSERLTEALTDSGQSAVSIYQKIGVSKAIWYRWADGTTMPNAENAFKLADALRVSPRWLITGEGKKARKQPLYSPEQEHIADLWPYLPDAIKHTINVLVNDYVVNQVPELKSAFSNATQAGASKADTILSALQNKLRQDDEKNNLK